MREVGQCFSLIPLPLDRSIHIFKIAVQIWPSLGIFEALTAFWPGKDSNSLDDSFKGAHLLWKWLRRAEQAPIYPS